MDKQTAQTPSAARRVPRSIGFLIAVVILIAAAWAYRAITTPLLIVEGPASTVDRISPAAFMTTEELERLIGEYEARSLEHTDASDHRILGSLYLEAGRVTGDDSRYLQAARSFQRATELFPSDPVSRVGAAQAAMAVHDFATALAVATEVHDQTGRLDAMAVIYDANLALGRYEEAIPWLERIIQESGALPAILVRQAEWARVTGDENEALRLARQAVEDTTAASNPRLQAWYLTFASYMSYELGRYEEGLTFAAEAKALDPEATATMVAEARLMNAVGDYAGAVENLEKARSLSADPTLLVELGDLYAHTGRETDARTLYTAFEETAAGSEIAAAYTRALAFHFAGAGADPEKAVQLATADLAVRADLGAYDALGWALHASGRHEEAWAASEEALRLGSADAHFNYHAGMIAAELGEVARATMLLERALDISPGFSPADVEVIRAELRELR